jgi:type IV secretory pathway VirB3-like protein
VEILVCISDTYCAFTEVMFFFFFFFFAQEVWILLVCSMLYVKPCTISIFNRINKINLILIHWHTQPAVRRAEPSMPLLLILALCQ